MQADRSLTGRHVVPNPETTRQVVLPEHGPWTGAQVVAAGPGVS